MKKMLLVVFLICACSLFTFAQENPKAEVFAGYQWTSVDFGSGVDRQNFNGWNGALTGYFNKNLGITADFSGAYKTIAGENAKLHSFTFGPTLRAPMGKATPYFHALFGGAHASGAGMSENAFAYAFGGGLDVNVGKRAALRIGQFDYFGTHFQSENQKNFRYSAGVVFKF